MIPKGRSPAQNLGMLFPYYKELIALFVLLSGRKGIFKSTVFIYFFPATKATNGKHFNDGNVFDVLNLLNMEEGWLCVWPLQ